MKNCRICKQNKDISQFSKRIIRGKEYVFTFCKHCNVLKAGEWAKNNVEKNREKSLRNWRRKHNKIITN